MIKYYHDFCVIYKKGKEKFMINKEIHQDTNGDEYEKTEALSEIVSYIDSTEVFEDIISEILGIVGRSLKVSNAGMMTIGKEESFDIFTEWTNGNKMELFDRACEDIWDKSLVYNDEMYVMSSDEYEGKREFLYTKYGISALLARPVMIQNKVYMIMVVADDKRDRIWSLKDIEFITNVVRIVEGIIIRKMSHASLYSSQTAMREILDNMSSALMVVDKENREILFSNIKMLELIKSDMCGKKCSDFHMCSDKKMCDKCTKLKNMDSNWESYDARYKKWFDIKTSDISWVDGNRVTLFAITDITEKKKSEKRIEFQANNDFLTGLYNRMRCEADLYETITKAVNEQKSGYIMFIDLDNFKHINDGLGHQHGDMLLKLISMGLQQIDGISDCCYRVGGDEFVILIYPEQKDNVERIIKDITDMFNKPWLIDGTEYYSTMSMGIVSYPEDGTDVNDLLKKADIAMYEAKKAGKNRIEYYNASEEGLSIKRLDVEKNMRTAIAVGGMEFELYIQPIMDAVSGECIGGEALIRWNSHELGFLMPVDFIPLAEHLGLIVIIGEYFLRKACQINRKWSDMGVEKKLHVNLSIVQLVQKNVVETITNIINETGVNPANIILEVTESLAINDMANMRNVINEIKKLGVGIALDDFGTGYSSLNYIKQMNFDIIKVDKNFIDDITTDDYAQTFIKLITELSEKLGAKVCVEGVEESEQLEILKSMNVNMIQGYYYGKPLPYKQFQEEYLGMKDRILQGK